MEYLTPERLNELSISNIYNLPFTLNCSEWLTIDNALYSILNAPKPLVFDSTIRDRMNDLKRKKGIYMFIIEPEFPLYPKINYLVYIGRVIESDTFFKRFYDYVKAIGAENVRRNIQLLTNLWPEKTWVYFHELDIEDEKIIEIERELINKIVPPLNNQFYCDSAKNSRSIYN